MGGALSVAPDRILAQSSQGQPPSTQTGQKQWKDRAEYDLYDSILKDSNPQTKLEKLNQWKEKYSSTDFASERRTLLLSSYAATGQVQNALTTANEILTNDPKDFTALYYITLLTPQVPAATKAAATEDQLGQAEKASNSLLNGGLDAQFAADKKPANVTDDQWKKARNDIEAVAHTTLGWVALQRKQYDQSQTELRKSLAINANNGDVDYWLGTAIIGEKKPEKQAEALFYFARAASYDGPGALNPQGRAAVLPYVSKAYTTYHGNKEGLDQLLQTAKTSATMPADFKVVSAAEIEKQKYANEQEFGKAHPDIALWRNLKAQLQAADGEKYFETGMKGALLPPTDIVPGGKFTGKLVSAEPELKPKTLVLAIDGEEKNATLHLDAPLPGKADPGTVLSFSGVAESFTKEPFMVAFTTEKKNIVGWPVKAAEAPARKAPVRRKRR